MFVNLYSKLWFAEHTDDKINKAIKSIGLLHKLQVSLQSYCFITIYKSFVKLHLEYSDVTCDQLFNNYFSKKSNQSNQYSAALAIIGSMGSRSKSLIHLNTFNKFS